MGSRAEILKLYKSLMREAQRFHAYNFRHYAVRKTRDTFKDNKNLSDPAEIANLVKAGEQNLDMIKRQNLISQLYCTDKLVIEHLRRSKKQSN